MRFVDRLVVNLFFSAAEAYVLLRTTLPNYTFQQVFARAFGLNFAAQAIWALFIWPFVFNPLRHLPKVNVGPGQLLSFA
jgi:hypothetical protein